MLIDTSLNGSRSGAGLPFPETLAHSAFTVLFISGSPLKLFQYFI